MRNTTTTLVLAGLMIVPLGAQGRGGCGDRNQGVPPGHLPPPGLCRVWYDNRPPGRQPRATNCRDAERTAARDRRARVIYGAPVATPYPNRSPYPGAPYPYPAPYPGPNRGPYPNRYPGVPGGYAYGNVAWDSGYRDGYDKGREDARDRDSYDPVRHSRYRSADRGYNKRYGPKDQYKLVYRDGFEAGYDRAYREWRHRRGF